MSMFACLILFVFLSMWCLHAFVLVFLCVILYVFVIVYAHVYAFYYWIYFIHLYATKTNNSIKELEL